MKQFEGKFGPAVIQALILCVVRFFTIPWLIWKGAVFRLAALRQATEEDKNTEQTSEFPVFNWFRTAWDGIIFLSWPVTAIIATFALLGGLINGYAEYAFGAFIITVVYGYFAVILMSLAKESLILFLSIALNVERIHAKQAGKSSDNG
ncbi:hypothetical protein FM042_04900 [Aliidiomarina halalkaliphila]|uniref:DUF4282 domain-containing protein n=1 Tax=Aliidiomarina halalkaliphila TaxID=2593535 RepID=A0A552X591_9GAMM|nr:hypothetical protein [Aliidiomarina halalkaliphila]TRW50175.1 hypothetical protein FM042_04900 [Aliidiomarina halalkaliphila]